METIDEDMLTRYASYPLHNTLRSSWNSYY